MSKTYCNGCEEIVDETDPHSIKHGYTYCLKCTEDLKEIEKEDGEITGHTEEEAEEKAERHFSRSLASEKERQEVNDLFGGSME